MQDETERAEPETAAAAPDGQSGPGPRQAAGADDAGAESAGAAETTEASEADGTGGQEAAAPDEGAPDEGAPDEGASDEADGNEAADEATEAGEAGDHEVGADEVGDEAGADEVGDEAGADESGDAPEADGALRDQLLRALADAENARRRARKDVEEARTYAISRFAQDLLGVADNLGRALASIPAERREGDEAVKAIADGIEMTAREFEAVLARHGITRIDPLGEKFDYNYHQALFETADTDRPDGTVVQVLQTGYRIGDRLLREAMVGVAKGGAGEGDAGEGDVGEGDVGEAGAGSEAEGAQAPADDPA